jgi:hypothetical protein
MSRGCPPPLPPLSLTPWGPARQFVLECPSSVYCFSINQDDPNIIIAGLLSGQVQCRRRYRPPPRTSGHA